MVLPREVLSADDMLGVSTANCVDIDPYAYTPKTSDLRWEIVLLRGEMPLNPSSAKICS
jgi:hypothetical protein